MSTPAPAQRVTVALTPEAREVVRICAVTIGKYQQEWLVDAIAAHAARQAATSERDDSAAIQARLKALRAAAAR